jgi:dihydroorotase
MMSINPAKILGIEKGTLSIGADADITIINPKLEKEITSDFVSLSKNSPFIGMKLKGFAVITIVGGVVIK